MYKCEKHGYTLEQICRICSKETVKICVPKFGPERKNVGN